MRTTLKTVIASVTLAFAASPAFAQNNSQLQSCLNPKNSAAGLSVVGLTSDQRLVCFAEKKTQRVFPIGYVQGLSGGDTSLIGIDYRVQDGNLYGVGNGGGVYLLNTSNATATFVNSLINNNTPVALSGTSFGVDFNPAADRLRIVSDNGQNLRHNVNLNGITLSDDILNNGANPPVTVTGVVGAAYTNNDLSTTTGTLLFDINSATDQLAIQAPPNAGAITPFGMLTVDTSAVTGFDIYSTVTNGVSVANQGLAVLTVNSTPGLYSINLLTGSATLRGALVDVVDIAIPLNQP